MRSNFRWVWTTALVGLGGLSGPAMLLGQEALDCPTPPDHTESNPSSDVRYLADDRLEGREVASEGARCAAAFIEARFRHLGLSPAYDEFQVGFTVRKGYELGSHNVLEAVGASHAVGQGWMPFGFTATGMAEAPLVAVDVADLGGDIRTGLAHSGVVDKLVLAHPAEAGVDPHAFATAAAAVGAVGVLWVVAELPELASETRPAVGVPVAAVVGDLAIGLARVASTSEAEGPANVTLMTQVEARQAEAFNVVAVIPGPHWPRGEAVVVGAHYDHLGHGGSGSLAPDEYGAVHNGADDNASGTAAMLDVARRLADRTDERPGERSVILAAFTGEEQGLWGSARFVEEPPIPVEDMVAMINMDMVGRLETGGLTIFGMGTAEEWDALVSGAARADLEAPLEFTGAPDGYGPSDHSSFYGRDIPVLHLFTNTHTDYHRPTDDAERVDGEGVRTVASLVTAITERLIGNTQITLIKGAGRPVVASSPDDEPAPTRGYGAYLGTIPDMSGSADTGVKLTGVREGSPAAAAGLEAGDILVGMAGIEITDLYAFTYVLRDHQPGDEVEIEYMRNGRRRTAKATLGQR